MINLVYVGVGGAAGSLVRFHLGKVLNERYAKYIPVGTLVINITGAFLLGIVVTSVKTESWQLLFVDGFLGAYTTFSTFLYEGFMLFNEGEKRNALGYLGGSILIGVLGFGLGTTVGAMLLQMGWVGL